MTILHKAILYAYLALAHGKYDSGRNDISRLYETALCSRFPNVHISRFLLVKSWHVRLIPRKRENEKPWRSDMQTTTEPPTIAPPETRIHKAWRITANTVQVIIISVMFLLIVGIILLFVFIPLFC